MQNPNRPIPVVACGIIDEEDNILLMKREREPYKGYWCLPGGKIEFAESIEDACKRELKEETGIEIKFKALKGVLSEVLVEENKQHHFILFACEVEPLSNKVVSSDEGVVKWFSLHILDSMKEVIIPSDHYMIKELILKGEIVGVTNFRMIKKGNKYKIESMG